MTNTRRKKSQCQAVTTPYHTVAHHSSKQDRNWYFHLHHIPPLDAVAEWGGASSFRPVPEVIDMTRTFLSYAGSSSDFNSSTSSSEESENE